MLCEIFFKSEDIDKYKKYFIPLQGNWWLPTEQSDEKISTWIGYNIVSKKGFIRARRISNETGSVMAQTCIAKVHLQFIGKDAETWASSVIMWDERTDVPKALERYAGQLFYEAREVIPTPYYHDGQNATFAHNIDFRFIYLEVVDPKNPILTGVEVSGKIVY